LPTKSVFLILFVFCATIGATPPPSQTELEESLACQCGCGLTVHSCNHLQCGFAIPRKNEIAQFLDEGKGQEEILASFVSSYGEKVLSAPTKTGFNLVAWITPFVVVFAGAVLIGMMSMRWTKRESQGDTPEPHVPAVPDEYRDRLKKELADFDS
jgi:cytochrome c-type biogenesis protein CcmH